MNNFVAVFDIFKKVINIFVMILLFLIILFSILSMLSKLTNFKNILGFSTYVVKSDSMTPKFKAGDLIINKNLSLPAISKLKAGDIITYSVPTDLSTLVTHRIVDTIEENDSITFITRGDANNADDKTPVIPERIQGKTIFSIPYFGYAIVQMRNPFFLMSSLILIVLLQVMPFILKK